MPQPTVTIITATRNLINANRAAAFRQCVESVRAQDYPNIQHLVIDGASDDGTIELFKDLGVEYSSEPDTGIFNAYNRGIKLARGEYIVFLNSDDFFIRNDAVTMTVAGLVQSGADYTYAPIQCVDICGNPTRVFKAKWRLCFAGMPFGHPGMFARRDMLVELGGFDETYQIASDFDLVMRAILGGYRPVYVPVIFSAFRDGGVSSTNNLMPENSRVLEKNLGLAHDTAELAARCGYVPWGALRRLIRQAKYIPNRHDIWWYNLRAMWWPISRWILTVRTRRGVRVVRIMGLTLYKEKENK